MNIINQIYKLAINAYSKEQISSIDFYSTLYTLFPENFIMEYNNDIIIGYIIICYLSEDFQISLSKGFQENQINFLNQKKGNNIYLFSIVCDSNFPLSSFKLIKRLQKYIKNNDIQKMSALIYSENGEKLANLLKMKQVSPKIYQKNFNY